MLAEATIRVSCNVIYTQLELPADGRRDCEWAGLSLARLSSTWQPAHKLSRITVNTKICFLKTCEAEKDDPAAESGFMFYQHAGWTNVCNVEVKSSFTRSALCPSSTGICRLDVDPV